MKKNILVIIFSIFIICNGQAQIRIDNTDHDHVCESECHIDTIPRIEKLTDFKTPSRSSLVKSSVVPRITSQGTLHSHIPNKINIDKNKMVGEIPITEGTGPTGARTYNVPIRLAQGREGAQPQVSIAYNSQGGDGVLGKGWSIGGMSAITRGNLSIYYDGKTSGATNSVNDAFYLNGMRLIKINQNSRSVFYQSERGNTKVEGIISSNKIKYFKVRHPNGAVSIFGYTSKLLNRNVFPITKFTDIHSNDITYSYYYDYNNFRLKTISYGGSSSKKQTNYAYVVFNYKTNSNESFTWHNGVKTYSKYLLNSIICKDPVVPVHIYSFSYKAGKQKLLDKISCQVNGIDLNPLKFYYGENSQVAKIDKYTTDLGSWYNNTSVKNLTIKKGKFQAWSNDDGLIVYPSKNAYVQIYQKGGTFKHSKKYYYNMMHADQQVLVYHGLENSFSFPQKMKAGSGFVNMFAADIDGVSDDEVIKVNLTTNGSKDKVSFRIHKFVPSSGGLALWKTKTFETSTTLSWYGKKSVHPKFFYPGDFNGDGRQDVLAVSCNKPLDKSSIHSRCYLYDLHSGAQRFDQHVFDYNIDFSSPDKSDIIIPFDYNADGKTDIGLINASGLHIYTFNISGSSYKMSKVAIYTGITKSTIKNKKFMLGEFNGDGKIDLIVSPNKSYTRNTGRHVAVCSPERCYHCGERYPLINGYRNECSYCRKPVRASSRCIKCRSRLESRIGPPGPDHPEDPRSVREDSRSPYGPPRPDGPGGQLSCSRHGTSVYMSMQKYVDNGKRWVIHYGKGNGSFESKTLNVKNYNKDDKYVLQDMNGDGTTDLVCTSESGFVTIYPARNGLLSTEKFSATQNVGRGAYMISSSIANGNYHSQLLSLNNNKIQKLRYSVNELGQQLLTGVVNSFGLVSKTRFQMMNSGHYGLYSESYGATFPYQKINGPIYLTAETQTWLNNTKRAHLLFRYHNALIHRQGLGFRGFEKVITSDRIRSKTSTNYYDPKKFGILTKQEGPQATLTNQYSVSVASNKIAKVRLTKKTLVDKLKGNTVTTSYVYDSYGNPTKESVRFGGPVSSTTSMTYSNTNSSSTYLLGLPLTKTVTQNVSRNTFTEKTQWTYSNYYPSKIRKYANNNLVGETNLEYDVYGNVISKKEKAYSSSKIFTTRYKYGSLGRYLKESINYMNQNTTYTLNGLGQVTGLTNFNGKTTKYTYDKLGRKTQVSLPDGSITNYSYKWDTSSANFLYKVTESSNTSPSCVEYFDALGRSLRKGSIGFGGKWVYSDIEFDLEGKLKRESNPYFSGATKHWTSYAYDSNDRVSSVTSPTGAKTTFSYSGNSVTTKKAGRTSTKTTNARGDLISASDPGGTITYSYRADGQPVSIIAPGDIKTSFQYDKYGRKTKIIDPSAGTVQYKYDADGNLLTTIDGNNKSITNAYDKYNRLIKKQTPEFSTNYKYNTDGLLTSASSNNGTSSTYSYNSLMQLTSKSEKIDGQNYSETYTYKNGLISSTTYSTLNYTVNYAYNSNKYLASLKHNGKALWSANTIDALGKLRKQTLGNGVVVNNSYDSYGLPTEVKTLKGSKVLQHFGYSFNRTTGNLTSRSDRARNLTESFDYDNLDRLTRCDVLGRDFNVSYQNNGNISYTTELDSYQYKHKTKPYAVTSVKNLFCVSPAVEQIISYTSFKRPSQINELSATLNFKYNDAFYRSKTVLKNGGSTTTKYSFAGGKYEKESKAGVSIERLYIGGSPYSAPIVLEKKGNTINTLYIHRDYLGSITHLSNKNGTLEAEYSYTAWGLLRNPANWDAYSQRKEPTLRLGRGYTGHEHLFTFGLINMNGRMYDPLLKRFLSPDNYIQSPDFTQNFNRFGYCLNNPLKYTDESGEFFGIDDLIAGIVGGVINLAVNIYQGNIDNIGEGLVSFGAGFAAGALATYGPAGWAAGGAILGAANSMTSQMTSWSQFGDINFGQVATDCVVGGVSGLAGGYAGKFASKLSSFAINGVASPVLRGTVGGVIGGGAGGYTGGFASGLLTTGDFKQAHQSGLAGAKSGAFIGGITGAGAGYKNALENGMNPWNGKIDRYPVNNGFDGKPSLTILESETIIDRYGSKHGKFTAPEGTPFNQRSLHPTDINKTFNTYKVIKPIPALKGNAVPWFNQKGGGIQYKFSNSVGWYIDNDYLIKL